MKGTDSRCVVILDNVRSAHNVGSIFRTAEAAGVAEIYLCGYTPTPVDRFGRNQPEIAKTALGAEVTMPWEHYADISACIEVLKSAGLSVVAVEQTKDAVDYRAYTCSERTAFIFGNEVDGVSAAACAAADTVIHIPMHGEKESLNVSVAVGVVLFNSI